MASLALIAAIPGYARAKDADRSAMEARAAVHAAQAAASTEADRSRRGIAKGESPASAAAAPESQSYAMVLAGLGLMAFAARRRSRALEGTD